MAEVIQFIEENLPLILCLLFGAALLVVEVFMPGFGLPGISGLVLLIVGITLIMIGMKWWIILIVDIALVLIALIALLLMKTDRLYVERTDEKADYKPYTEQLAERKAKEAEEVDCAFAVIDPILQQNSRVYRLKSPAGEETTKVTETEDSFAVLPVDVLTELIFGVKNPTELALEQEMMPGMVLTDRFIEEWKKLIPLAPVFLNEIV